LGYTHLLNCETDEYELKDARFAMVNAVKIVLRNSLKLLGIEALERM
jgi:arginyl-tRNA synthetase